MEHAPSPAAIAAGLRARDATDRAARRLRYDLERRTDARAHGYTGPLTREEASRIALATLAGH